MSHNDIGALEKNVNRNINKQKENKFYYKIISYNQILWKYTNNTHIITNIIETDDE